MSPTTLTRHPLEERGAAYTELVALMNRRAQSLHNQEREILSEAADALLFDEQDREEIKQQAEQQIEQLREAGRWTDESSDQALQLLEAIQG